MQRDIEFKILFSTSYFQGYENLQGKNVTVNCLYLATINFWQYFGNSCNMMREYEKKDHNKTWLDHLRF